MSVALVTVEDAKARLRIVHDAEDIDLELMIQQASASVMNYLGLAHNYYETGGSTSSSSDSASSSAVPDEVQLAVLMMVGILARDRDGVEAKDWDHGYLPRPVTSLLYPLRDPALG
jgi:hypothetical protein